jgi:hypothetical protein
MPTTGTRSENGATTPAGFRLMSVVHMPDPTIVAGTTM